MDADESLEACSESSSYHSAENQQKKQQQLQPDRYGFLRSPHVSKDVRSLEAPIPIGVLRARELKWRNMIEQWDLFTTKKFKKLRDRSRKGIPPSMRMVAWTYLSEGVYRKRKHEGLFKELDGQPGEQNHIDDILKDVDRQFPEHEFFQSEDRSGQRELFRLLKAYTILRPDVGYCQGQAPVAALLLMHMPIEDAFFCFAEICDRYLNGYYNVGLETVQLDGWILFGLLKRFSPKAYQLLIRLEVEPLCVIVEWFMCAYIRTLPWPCVLRIFDMFLCEGIRVLFKVGIVLIDSALRPYSLRKKGDKNEQEAFEVLQALKRSGDDWHEEYLTQRVIEVELTLNDLIREHKRQLTKRQKKDSSKDASKSKRSS